uniref:PHD-type domain-containing protein n=1 Tax=Panagrolaimus sp. PS1159 TaxID=55785 RepID=A0AC35FPV4_9BILA
MDVQMEKQEEENQEKEEIQNNDTVEMNTQNGTTTPITAEAPTQNGTIPDAFRPSIDEEEEDETQMSTSMIEMDDENTQGSLQSSAGESSRISKKSWGTRPLPAEVLHVEIHPSQIIEYEWPLKSGKRFFIQEQIAQLLGVTSFKRKFPELSRRSLAADERKYLVEELKLGDSMPLHLMNCMTVLESSEVHQLMSEKYPEIYNDYQKSLGDKIRQNLIEKQRLLDVLANDKDKLAELRAAALKNCSNFNKDFNGQRKGKSFFEQHTQIIMVPQNRFYKLKPEYTKPYPYPVALIDGQRTNVYKRYTPEELKKLPLKTVLENDDIFPPLRRGRSPPSVAISDLELQKMAAAKEKSSIQRQSSFSILEPASPKTPKAVSSRRQSAYFTTCQVCKKATTSTKQSAIQCVTCLNYMHPECLDMTPAMTQIVKQYQWSCIDCKKCTECMKPDNEDAMMCCDNCDRGYHTFCLGLTNPPTGTWVCDKFCST